MTTRNDDALERLQDLLYGWADQSYGSAPAELYNRVNDLYQEAGDLMLVNGEVDDNEPTTERIEAFIREKVMPLVINGV